MFTIFHMFMFLGPLAGLASGVENGRHFGILGGCVGAVAGTLLGFLVGRLPWRLALWFGWREVRTKSTPQLWNDVRDDKSPNFVLAELRRRGEPMVEGWNLVSSLLTSADNVQRRCGFAALLSAFPEEAERLKDYSPSAPEAMRREINNQAGLAAS